MIFASAFAISFNLELIIIISSFTPSFVFLKEPWLWFGSYSFYSLVSFALRGPFHFKHGYQVVSTTVVALLMSPSLWSWIGTTHFQGRSYVGCGNRNGF